MLAAGKLKPVDIADPKALTLNGSELSLTFDPETGGISSLVDKVGGREWVAAGQRLGEFVYRTYTQKHDINPYMRQFVPGHPVNETDMKTSPWSKPGMDLSIESDPAMPPLANCSRAWPVRLLKAWRSERTTLLQLALPAAAVALFGGMGEIALNVTLPAAASAAGGQQRGGADADVEEQDRHPSRRVLVAVVCAGRPAADEGVAAGRAGLAGGPA